MSLLCFLFGHRWRITYDFQPIICLRCGRYLLDSQAPDPKK